MDPHSNLIFNNLKNSTAQRPLLRFLFSLLIFPIITTSALSQNDLSYYLPEVQSLNPNLTTPEDFLGFQIGEWHISHSQQVYYLKKLAEESDRIHFLSDGKTHEDRPLISLIISHPDNLSRLEEIRQNHLQWSEPDSEEKMDAKNRPLVVWQGYSIHGNEPSGANAAMLVAYYLAAGNSAEIMNILKNTVIILYPSFNPDGLQRFATWVNMNKSKIPNPDNKDREYNEAWPAGRTNHYGFDLNRDWLAVQQPESQSKIRLFQRWRPNILTDHHEMGTNSTFFFQPGIPSRTHPLTPAINQQLTEKIGHFHARALDSIGSLYYSKESFDDFFYGKGSTYPDIQGSIGILFEQGSSRGHIQNSDHGLLTFPFTIRNQFITSFSTLRAGLSLKEELLAYQRDFYRSQDFSSGEGYVFGHLDAPYKTTELAKILKQHNIDIYLLKTDLKTHNQSFSADASYYVPLGQRQQQLIRALFETNTVFQDSLFYDVSSLTLPSAFNLPYERVKRPGNTEKVDNVSPPTPTPFTPSSYAYILPWNHYQSPKVLFSLLREDIRVFVATSPFSYKDQEFGYGSLMIPLQNQDRAKIHDLLKDAVEKDGVPVFPIPTGMTDKINLGSRNFKPVQQPKIALITGAGTSAYSSGEVWHLLDTRYHIPVTRLEGSSISYNDLDAYNVLILASGQIRNLHRDKLANWISNGGTFIVLGSAGKWAESQKLAKFNYKPTPKIDSTTAAYDQISDLYGARVTGGTILRADIDPSHPINYGYRDKTLSVFKNNNYVFEPDPLHFKNPVTYAKQPLLSGYLHPKNEAMMAGGSALQMASLGKGRVINFADNPNFRAFWYGTNRLFANAVFFGSMVDRRATR